MKNLLLSTAAAAAFSLPAFAETNAPAFLETASADRIHASDFIGMRVYASEAEMDSTASNGIDDGWDDIGEINDILISRSGDVNAVLVDIGGFLGMGERQVAIEMNSIKFVSDDATSDDPDDYFLVLNAPRTLIEGAPEYHTTEEMEVAANAEADEEVVETDASDVIVDQNDTKVADSEPATPAVVDVTTITAEELTGTRVYDANKEDIGEVSEVLLTAEGMVDKVIVDVGGFLGLGEKPVALQVSDLNIQREADDDDLWVAVGYSMDELKGMPTYED